MDHAQQIMVGGESDVVERCRPKLEPMGKVFTTGGSRIASGGMKAMNNFLSAANLRHRGGSSHCRSALRSRPGAHDRHLLRVDRPQYRHGLQVPEQRAAVWTFNLGFCARPDGERPALPALEVGNAPGGHRSDC